MTAPSNFAEALSGGAIIQADRVAAARFLISRSTEAMVLAGQADSQPLVQAFAAHRIAALLPANQGGDK